MIKNPSPRVLRCFRGVSYGAACLLVTVATGCSHPNAPPATHQGIIELDERVLGFEVAGRVDEVAVRRGDVVEAGSPIAKLDDSLERLARQARADEANVAAADLALLEAGARREEVGALASELAGAIAAEDLARKNAERVRTLAESGSLAKSELDRVNGDLERATAARRSVEQRLAALRQGARPQEIARARARLDAARDALALADARLERYALKSKSGGIVLDVHLDPGELATAGTPAVTIADVTHPYVDVFVPQGELAGIHVGTKASVRVDGRDALANGAVEYVSPTTEFTPRFLFSERERPLLVVRVRVRIDDPNHELHAGIPAFARFSP